MYKSGITASILALSLAGMAKAQTKPLPLPPPVKFEEVCLQSGGAAGAITPSASNGTMIYSLLEADRPILFTFNQPVWNDPNTSVTSAQYGTITSTRKEMRELQLGVKFGF